MSIVIPQITAARPTAYAALEHDLEALDARKQAWATLSIGKKIELLERVKQETVTVAERWVRAALRAKRIPDGSPLAGEEWSSGPWALLYALNRYVATLGQIAKYGHVPIKKSAVRKAKNGQVIVDVFPPS